jgi:hypothetical protein
VPIAILENRFDHRHEHPDDNGTTWTPGHDGTEHAVDRWQSSGPK